MRIEFAIGYAGVSAGNFRIVRCKQKKRDTCEVS